MARPAFGDPERQSPLWDRQSDRLHGTAPVQTQGLTQWHAASRPRPRGRAKPAMPAMPAWACWTWGSPSLVCALGELQQAGRLVTAPPQRSCLSGHDGQGEAARMTRATRPRGGQARVGQKPLTPALGLPSSLPPCPGQPCLSPRLLTTPAHLSWGHCRHPQHTHLRLLSHLFSTQCYLNKPLLYLHYVLPVF